MDTIYLGAAPGTTWALTPEEAEEHLQVRFPGMESWLKHAPVSDKDYVDFDVEVDGEVRQCSYFGGGQLILRDGDPAVWADTIAWFLGLLPPEARTVAMVAANPDNVRVVPPGSSTSEIEGLLQSLFDLD
ncbi:hypothetical protein ABTZ03_44030 [Kitasatospora sp. NPDC096077]|uniref:hypothetical protein n=1 Tax=Kitasatospora sp. NPDC096077 TaxID=3155544 RepID=UPI0033349E0F